MNNMLKALIISLALILAYDLGLETGIRNKPQFDASQYAQSQCDDIIRYEDGSLVCEINLQAEDDDIKVFTPKEVVTHEL